MFSKFVRRTHMYLALFLLPWVLLYAMAVMVGNHRAFFQSYYGGKIWEVETEEEERVYEADFPTNATLREMGAQILAELDMTGPYTARLQGDDGRLVIHRSDPVARREIIYTPADGKLIVKHPAFRMPLFLLAMHHRHGYSDHHLANNTWALAIDFTLFGMVFWVASGLWMWWQIKPTRRLGSLCLLISVGLFGFFLLVI